MKAPHETVILIVDDEQILRDALSRALRRLGYHVQCASGGHDAREICLQRKIDLVITDMQMADGNGLELLRLIQGKKLNIPVVMCITDFDRLDLESAYDEGAVAVFSKPYRRQDLIHTIQQALSPLNGAWASRRETERFDRTLSIHLQFPELSSVLESEVVNFGKGGMFVRASENLPLVGESIRFQIVLEREPFLSQIKGSGIVKWVRAQPAAAFPSGFGVQFTSLDEASRKRLFRFINALKTCAFIPKK